VNYEIWTDKGWSPIRRVIRHKTEKTIYRVSTHTGTVDVTEDHSLLSPDRKLIRSKDVVIGTKLLHSYPSFENNSTPMTLATLNSFTPTSYEDKKAFIDGMFFGDGSCGKYESKWGVKYSWAINNQNKVLL
jgi:hypothetical protein